MAGRPEGRAQERKPLRTCLHPVEIPLPFSNTQKHPVQSTPSLPRERRS